MNHRRNWKTILLGLSAALLATGGVLTLIPQTSPIGVGFVQGGKALEQVAAQVDDGCPTDGGVCP